MTNAGCTRDGIQGIRPNEFKKFFQLALSSGGEEVLLTDTDTPYITADGYHLIIQGLADLGVRSSSESPYDICYDEDEDNFVDIILSGDKEAVKQITHVILPSSGEYLPLYKPGGPGIEPVPGVTYTAPSTYQRQPVAMALDDPRIVNYCAAVNEESLQCGAKKGKAVCCFEPELVCNAFNTKCIQGKIAKYAAQDLLKVLISDILLCQSVIMLAIARGIQNCLFAVKKEDPTHTRSATTVASILI